MDLFPYVSSSIVLVTPFIDKPQSSKDLTIFIISSISLIDFIYNVILEPIPVSTADATVVNPSGIKTLLTNGVSTFFIKD